MTDLTKRLQTSLNRIKKCGGIVLVHHAVDGGQTQYQLQNGRSIATATVKKLLEAGALESGRDGLLEGLEQTYRAVAA